MELGDVGPPTVDDEECDTTCETCEADNAESVKENSAEIMKTRPEVVKAVQQQDNGTDDDEDVCRICRTPCEDDSPLFYPCACSGSIKYVHQECLLQWLSHSNTHQCEVCKHSFAFSPVYAHDTPTRLPFLELVLGVAVKVGRGARFCLRLAFVLSVWLIFIPFTTFWIWRFTFVRSFAEAQRLFLSRCGLTFLLTDCLHGFLLSAGIIFIFLGATSLREYFHHQRALNPRHINGGRQGLHGGAQRVRVLGRLEGQPNLEGQGQAPAEGVDNHNDVDINIPRGLAIGAGDILRQNAENVAAHLEIQAARLEAHVEQIFDAVEEADAAEDVPFDELVGMQGSIFRVLENAITVLASNAMFLGLVTLVPFTLGRLVLSIASRIVWATGNTKSLGASPFSNFIKSINVGLNATGMGLSSMAIHPKLDPREGDSYMDNKTLIKTVLGVAGFSTRSAMGAIDTMTEAMVLALKLSDGATVAVGYGVIILALSFYVGLVTFITYTRGEPVTVGRVGRVAPIVEAAPSIARQMMVCVRYIGTMLKVVLLLAVELGLFPLTCGWWLDVCTLAMFDVTLAHRLSFFGSSPLTSSLCHWLLGIVYMLQISIFISLLREVLRPGLLYFLKDPADPNYNPFRDLIDDPFPKHARRVILSVVVYASLIVMLVYMPTRLAIYVAPKMFPLDIRVSDPFTEIPADMVLFHLCIPFAVEHCRPRETIKRLIFLWISFVGWALGLSEFLLLGYNDAANNNQRHNNIQNRQVQDRLQRVQVEYHHGVNPQRVVGSTSSDNDDEIDGTESNLHVVMEPNDHRFATKITLLLFCAWMTLFFINSTLVLLPIYLGRALFKSLSELPITLGAKCNDIYAFNIGCYVVWATIAAVRYVVEYLRTHDMWLLLRHVFKWSAIVAKSIVLLTLWIVVIPVLIGLLFELLVVVPLRISSNENPVFLLYQDWVLGLFFLKTWTKLVMLGQRMPLIDDGWRAKFERVWSDGFSHLHAKWIFTAIIAPILFCLSAALCVPYIVARKVFPLFGYSYLVNSIVYRFAWLGCLLLGLLWCGTKSFHKWLLDLHNSIRDDRYLVGRHLHNFSNPRRAAGLAKQQQPVVCTVRGGERGGPVGTASSGPLDGNYASVSNDGFVGTNCAQDGGPSSGQEGITSS